MKSTNCTRNVAVGCAILFASLASAVSADANGPDDSGKIAELIVSKLRWNKGVALDVGAGDAKLAIQIARRTQLVMHCVEPEWNAVAQLRTSINSAGVDGSRITVQQGGLEKLAYPGLSANLVICGDEFVNGWRGRDAREIYRVLSPNGIAVIGQSASAAERGEKLRREVLESWLKSAEITTYQIVEEDGVWAIITRPRSPGWDDWTHRNHDPANTLSSQDQMPYTDFRPQWVSDYRPGLASAGIALADGRVVVAGLSYPDHPDTTPYIQVLDAFTGVELWAKVGASQLPIDRPPGMYSNREFCSDYAVVGDTLYLLGGKFCHVIDLKDGTIKRSLPIPAETKPAADDVWLYLSCVGDTLFGGIGPSPNVKVDWNSMNYRGLGKAVIALDRRTGALKWTRPTSASIASITVDGGQVYYCDEELNLRALNADTGQVIWSEPTGLAKGTVVAGCAAYQEKLWVLYNRPITDKRGGSYEGADLLRMGHNARELAAYATVDGSKLFDCDFGMKVAGFTFSGDTVYGMHQHSNGLAAADTANGKRLWSQPRWRLKCTASLATPNCLLYRSTETSILDLKSMDETSGSTARTTSFGGFRPTCTFAAIPANGMLYIQAPGCRCPSPIRGSMAMSPGEPLAPISADDRLAKGEAFDQVIATDKTEVVWSSWRNDRTRSGRSAEKISLPLKESWSHKVNGVLTTLSAGYGNVYCAADDGKAIALDARSGNAKWQYLTGAPIEVAPYLSNGRLYIGDQDGWVQCLRADNGQCIWRFRAALAEDRTVGYGRYASLWPVAGGVVVHDGTAYCAAGLLPSEGSAVFALDASTGKLKWQVTTDDAKRNYRVAHVPGGAMAVSDQHLYIPTKQAAPWKIDLANPEGVPADASPSLFGSRRGGPEIMLAGDQLVSVARGKEYVWHVKYVAEDTSQRLPIVIDDVAYLLNRNVSGVDGTCLVGAKVVKREGAAPETQLIWKAWPGESMNVMIEVGGILFSGGENKLYATSTADGKELWSSPTPSEATDLAFHDGHLFATCRNGEILCFEAPSDKK